MRTLKALVCAAALAAGLATSLAQSNVYSLNVVGYYNVPLVGGVYTMIANQLNTTNNQIQYLFPNGPLNAIILKWGGSSWGGAQFSSDDNAWVPDPTITLNPGEAGLFKSPVATTLTFVGEVEQGSLSRNLVVTPGQYIGVASIVPQAGLITTDLGFPGEPNDIVLKWSGTGWGGAQFSSDDLVWVPAQPTFGVGEGMLARKAPGGSTNVWTRNFTVQ